MDTLSYKEMAVEYPNIPSTTFRKWKSKGKLNPVEVVGASPRFARADIETCIKNYQPEKNSAPSRKRNAALRKATLFNDVDMPADGDGIKESQSVVGDVENFQSTNGQLEEAEPVKTTNANGLDTANGEVNTDAKNDSVGQIEETPDTNADKDNPQKGKEVDVQDGDASTLDTRILKNVFRFQPADGSPESKITVEEARAQGSSFDEFMAARMGLTVEEYRAQEAAKHAELAAMEEQNRLERIESLKEQIQRIQSDGRIPVLIKDLNAAAEYVKPLIDAGQTPMDSTNPTTQAAFQSAEFWYKELAEYQVALAECKEELARLGVEETVGANQSSFPSEDEPDDTPADDDATADDSTKRKLISVLETDEDSGSGSSEETAAPVDVTIESPSFKVEEMTLDARVERIRQLVKGIAYNVAQIGFELIEAKKQVRHGGWAQWLKENFQWTQQTAGNYMRIAERFGDGNLKNPFRFGRAVLLEMTKLPAGTEEKFIEAQAAAGKPVESMSAREAKKAVKQFKETQGEVKGVYVDVTLKGKNAATVEELNRDVELQSQAAVVEVPTANVESYAPMDKPDDTAAANADTDNPQKGKEIESRVKIFSRDVDAQLDDIRLLIEETTDAGDAKMIRVALKNLLESVNRITAGLDNKIEALQEAAMPSLLDG